MMYCAGGSATPAALSRSSNVTPCHAVSSFDHLVTQWISVFTVVCGSASNSSQVHLPISEAPDSSANVQSATLISGVGPAERTGNSVVTYWPGGTRPCGFCPGRLDLNPREIGASSIGVSLCGR